MQEWLTPLWEYQDGDVTVRTDPSVMRKMREFSPGRKEGKGWRKETYYQALRIFLALPPKKDVNSYDPYALTCLFYRKASLPNLRSIEVKRENVKWNK